MLLLVNFEMADRALALLGETEWRWHRGDPEEIFTLEGTPLILP